MTASLQSTASAGRALQGATSPEPRESSGPASLAAIVVYFRTPGELDACLQALREQTLAPTEIVVIDNSSALDGCHDRPAPGLDWKWICPDHNLGFGSACNLGTRAVESDYLLFVNADLVLSSDACERLYAMAENNPGFAAVGPRIYGADGNIELSARGFPSLSTGIAGRSSLLTRALARLGYTPPGVAAALGEAGVVDWVSGACMLVRRSAFEQVRGFDEAYWMYWEDADLCRRLKDSGWDVAFCPAARSRHCTGSSGQTERTIESFHRSAGRYYSRHIARFSITAGMARFVLSARMRVMLRRHARRRQP